MASYALPLVRFEDSNGGSEEYKMLLIGETGSGKTSFLNLLWNSSLIIQLGFQEGCKKFHNINDIELENVKAHRMESKTIGAKLYPNVQLAGDFMIGIVDTPGFGDSKGIDEDKRHSRTIVETLKSEEYINCIRLVINGRINRESVTLKYVMSEITAILPREILNNIVVVFTNTSSSLTLTFDPALLKKYFGKEIEDENIFLIENPYCHVEKLKEQGKARSLSTGRIAEDLKKSFEEASKEITKMSEIVRKFKRVHTHRFIELYKTKQEVERKVLALLTAFDNQRVLERMIMEVNEDIKAALRRKKLHEDFCTSRLVVTQVQVPSQRHNTLCCFPGCYSNCHIDCNLPMSMDKDVIKRCLCFDHGRESSCTECTHSNELHYHGMLLHKEQKEMKSFVDKEVKREFERAQSQEDRCRDWQKQLQCLQEDSEQERDCISKKLLIAITQFEKLGANRSYAKLLQNQLAVVEYHLKGVDPEKQKEFECLKRTQDALKKELKLVLMTLKEPWSPNADPDTQREWAYTILEVSRSATKNEILKAYKTLVKPLHPDKGGDDEHFKRLQRAQEILLSQTY